MEINLTTLKKAMIGQNEKNNIIANNLANLNTIGFKRDLLFAQTLEDKKHDSSEIKQETDFTQGTVTSTGNDLDLALTGPGFFTIETEDGQAYTRDGHFKMDADGILRTSSGQAVLGLNGWISLMKDGVPAASVEIAANGEVFVDGEPYDQLLIQNSENMASLRKVGDNLFLPGEDTVMYDVIDAKVAQGFLEESNVNPAQEMIDLIDIQRQFESVQRMVRTLDETFRIAASQVGQFR